MGEMCGGRPRLRRKWKEWELCLPSWTPKSCDRKARINDRMGDVM
jgi:hypothetical protein